MNYSAALTDLMGRLDKYPYTPLALLPTPTQPLNNLGSSIGLPGLWMKRDDLTGLEGGGNKTRKLEYLVGDALAAGADTLVTIGAIQSNHTRQTAAAAAKAGLKCSLLHCAWTEDASPQYRKVGNLLISQLAGAELYIDDTPRPIEDQAPLEEFVIHLKNQGCRPYVIPGGGSEHRLGCFGYIRCAAEIVAQSQKSGIDFDHVIHCTGSGSTQAGLLAGFAAIGVKANVIGVADDGETEIKKARVLQLANAALLELRVDAEVAAEHVEVIAASDNAYGVPDADVVRSIDLLARKEGLIADPVYEGRAILGLLNLVDEGRFEKNAKILLMHLGGSPAIHAYSETLADIRLMPFPG